MTRTRARRPAGFTLIELLVVIAILGVLAALTTAAVGRVLTVQRGRTTDQTCTKLQQALDQQWKTVVDRCLVERKSIPAEVLTYCDNDEPRAAAFWAYANMKREFPQTFVESHGDVCPNPAQKNGTTPFTAADTRRGIWMWNPTGSNPNATPAVLVPKLPPRATFNQLPDVNTGDAAGEAAVLLYLILTEKGLSGANSLTDDVTTGAQTDVAFGANGTFRAIRDGYGTPITFVRFTENAELNRPPYVPTAAQTNLFDSLDPKSTLWKWDAAGYAKAKVSLGVTFVTDAANPIWNRRATVVSAGPNKNFEGVANSVAVSDDVYGYRLTRLGNTGG